MSMMIMVMTSRCKVEYNHVFTHSISMMIIVMTSLPCCSIQHIDEGNSDDVIAMVIGSNGLAQTLHSVYLQLTELGTAQVSVRMYF